MIKGKSSSCASGHQTEPNDDDPIIICVITRVGGEPGPVGMWGTGTSE